MTPKYLSGFGLVLALLLLGPQSVAQSLDSRVISSADVVKVRSSRRQKRNRTRRKRSRRRSKITVPIDIAVGPVVILPNPSVFVSQPAFSGLEISLAGIIDQQLIRKYKRKIPRQYQRMARSVDEIAYRPWYVALIPERLILSPGLSAQGISGSGLFSTSMYGAVWRPVAIGTSLFKSGQTKVSLNLGLDFAYIFVHSVNLPSPTHFLRPGLNLEAVLRIPITQSFLLSMGWSSDLFIPQPLGAPPWAVWPLEQALWHLGGPFIKLHLRVPYTVTM